MLDSLCEFAREFPSLMHGGAPLSWRHFVYALAHLARAEARASVRMASAVGIGFADKAAGERWLTLQRTLAGW